ncbi:MAG: hypothetical protein ACKV0T_18375 [Planctomycetales bacterium]
MSRHTTHDPGFGSDSFLDVLANMVGILIILIVIAGVRVGRAPVIAKPSPAMELQATPQDSTPIDCIPSAPELAAAPLEPESDEPPPAILEELAALEGELAGLAGRQADLATQMQALKQAQVAAKESLSATQQTAARRKAELEEQLSRVVRLEQTLGDRQEVLTALLAEFEEAQGAAAPVATIKHRLAPVSQEVAGEEIQFRLLGNRVSVVPWGRLAERLKFQLERQKDWLAKHGRHQGSVGPVDGFSMRYTVERQALSALEERRLGYGAFRVGLSYVEIVPEPDAPAETASEALRRGSRFAAELQAAPEGATLTFWVYPDSFGLYRQLQEASHAEGFVVAARPLPAGKPIAGSPNGSRSAGQ